MKPLKHAMNSVRRHGGTVEDYLPIHNFFDSTKAAMPDIRHRAILHSAFGIFLLEQVFGVYVTNSDGHRVSIRDIGEDHVIEDLGFIPTIERWLKNLPVEDWMGGSRRKDPSKFIPMSRPLDPVSEHFEAEQLMAAIRNGEVSVDNLGNLDPELDRASAPSYVD